MYTFTYICLKFGSLIIRAFARLQGRIISSPDEVRFIPCRDSCRTIKVHVYKSAQAPEISPVLINLHGSGFMIPAHGSDDDFCRQVSQNTPYTVIDVQYRLAPENPFPAALDDTEDVVKWILEQPDKFDRSRVAISGFSAGATLALGVSSSLFPPETFCCVIAFYPLVDMFADPGTKVPPNPSGKPIPAFMLRFFQSCYIQSTVDYKDPRLSPLYAKSENFPNRVLVVTAACDSLAIEAEELFAKIKNQSDRHSVCLRMENCNHAWDKMAQEGTAEALAKEKAYDSAIELLQF